MLIVMFIILKFIAISKKNSVFLGLLDHNLSIILNHNIQEALAAGDL